MKDKAKVIEKLTGEPQPRELLAIQKTDYEQHWTRLILDGKTIDTNDKNIEWEINDKSKKVMAYIKANPKDDNTYLHPDMVRVVGRKEQIQNLLYNLGMGLPNERIEPNWKEKKEALDEVQIGLQR